MVTGGRDLTVRRFTVDKDGVPAEAEANRGHHGPVWVLRFAPDGESYASGSDDGTIRLWYVFFFVTLAVLSYIFASCACLCATAQLFYLNVLTNLSFLISRCTGKLPSTLRWWCEDELFTSKYISRGCDMAVRAQNSSRRRRVALQNKNDMPTHGHRELGCGSRLFKGAFGTLKEEQLSFSVCESDEGGCFTQKGNVQKKEKLDKT